MHCITWLTLDVKWVPPADYNIILIKSSFLYIISFLYQTNFTAYFNEQIVVKISTGLSSIYTRSNHTICFVENIHDFLIVIENEIL